MWIVFGNETKSERVPNGESVERRCASCGETAVFYERTVATKLSVYFIELLEYGKHRAMACGACGTLYATDELGAPAPANVVAAAEKAGSQISTAAKDAFGKLSAAAKSGLEQLGVGAPEKADPRRQEAAFDDPLTSDEEALEKQFRDLEKKYRVGE